MNFFDKQKIKNLPKTRFVDYWEELKTNEESINIDLKRFLKGVKDNENLRGRAINCIFTKDNIVAKFIIELSNYTIISLEEIKKACIDIPDNSLSTVLQILVYQAFLLPLYPVATKNKKVERKFKRTIKSVPVNWLKNNNEGLFPKNMLHQDHPCQQEGDRLSQFEKIENHKIKLKKKNRR
jgi:hypothetical protein